MVIDDLLVARTALVLHLHALTVLHRLGRLCVRLEALVLLDEGDEEVFVTELHVAPDLVHHGALPVGVRLEGGDHLGQAEVIERSLHTLPPHEPGVVHELGLAHLSLVKLTEQCVT